MMTDCSTLEYHVIFFCVNGFLRGLLTGDFSGFKSGFQEPLSMVDGGSYDPDKAYKDSKLVRGVVWCGVVWCGVVLCCIELN
jgi:hypothetical protein